MSCWVVPSVAAELWGTNINHVWERIRRGELFTKHELGFTLVDVAPESPQAGARRGTVLRPPTYTTAPLDEPSQVTCAVASVDETATALAEDDAQDERVPDDQPLNWREVRREVSLRRIAPRRPAIPASPVCTFR